MEAVFNSFLLVAASEMGDKTQLLAFFLATRFKKPIPILMGILVATVLNHLLAASFGNWVSHAFSEDTLKWILSATFVGFAIWILIPDRDDSTEKEHRFGAFITTTVLFFLAEMGDKTQLATVALAARFKDVFLVTLGTTLGMMVSDGLAVFFGEKMIKKISMKWMRRVASFLFFLFGIGVFFTKISGSGN